MKKLLSIALAAAMLAAVSVPSFAADKTLTSDHTSDTAKVITSTKTGSRRSRGDFLHGNLPGRNHYLLGRRKHRLYIQRKVPAQIKRPS